MYERYLIYVTGLRRTVDDRIVMVQPLPPAEAYRMARMGMGVPPPFVPIRPLPLPR